MSPLRLLVTVVVAMPLFVVVGWPHAWWTTLVIAVVAISAGYLAEHLMKRGRQPAESRTNEATRADRQWEFKMLLKKAIAAEERGDYEQATTLFDRALRNADSKEDVELARRHIQDIANKRPLENESRLR